MKVLFINPPDRFVAKTTSDWDIKASDIGIFPPIGLTYLAGALQAKTNHDVRIYDSLLEGDLEDDINKQVLAYKPDLIGMTAYTPTFYDLLKTAENIKKVWPHAHICVGGAHTYLFGRETLAHSVFDSVALGEGETVIVELANALKRGTSLEQVRGLLVRKEGQIVETGKAGYHEQLDELPYPAIDLLSYNRYFSAIGTGKSVGTILTSRGCPYSCTFCCKPYRSYRMRSVAHILGEMKLYLNRGIDEFFFFDDLFNISPQRVMDLSRAIIDNGWKIVWSFRGRVDRVTDEMLAIAKRAGCRQILFGVEAATDEGLKAIQKNISIGQVADAVRVCRRNGIASSTNWIIGFPHHRSREDIMDLIRTAVRIDSDFAQFNILIAYQGTDIFREGCARGLFNAEIWRDFVLHPVPHFTEPIWDEFFTREELSEMLRLCYKKFYFRPRVIMRRLKDIRNVQHLLLHVKGALTLLGFGGYRRQDA